jgi:hypothetical protein
MMCELPLDTQVLGKAAGAVMPLILETVVAPPVAVLVASPDSAVKVPEPVPVPGQLLLDKVPMPFTT